MTRGERALLALFAACFAVAPYLGLTSFGVDPRIAEVWPAGGVGVVGLALLWEGPPARLVAALGGMVAVTAATAVALGHPLADALWWALAGAAQSAATVWLSCRWPVRRARAPETPADLFALLLACTGTSLVLGLVGGFPHLPAGDLSKVLLWWTLRNTVFCFVGAATVLILFFGRRDEASPRAPGITLLPLLVVSALCVYGTYSGAALPLTWLLLVPSLWGGLTLGPRLAAGLALYVALVAAVLTFRPDNHFGYHGLLPAASIIDVLIIASTCFMLLLSLLREQRARLIAELDRRGTEAETQRRLLELVFEAMTDGVVVGEADRIILHNSAARNILGRAIPVGRAVTWADVFAVTRPDGGPVDNETFRRLLRPVAGGRQGMELLFGEGEDARLVDVTTMPLPWGARAATLVLLHDVTASRTQVGALREFAGAVAHDLRGPLTGLAGWLELVADGHESGDQDLAAHAVDRARQVSSRMRLVIEDWLNYTVVRDGELRPEPVALIDVAADITRDHQVGHEADAPHFELDLAHTVRADPVLLRQLIDNLVGNAVKYTRPGEAPRIALRSRADDEQGWVRVDVVDAGIGIPVGQEELIFDEFHRGGDHGRTDGTGLGLAITRRIVHRHGGRLRAVRNPDVGSTFTFTLPEA